MKTLHARWRRGAVGLVAAATAVAGLAVAPASPAHAQEDCITVEFQATTWSTGPESGGFVITITLTNVCDAPTHGWALALTLAPGHTLTQGWSANWTTSGAQVTATDVVWNADLGPGDSTTIGFIGTFVGTFQDPVSCTINGFSCGGGNAPPQVTLTSPAGGSTVVYGCPIRLAADAGDPDGEVERVEFYLNDMLVGTDHTAPYSVDTASVTGLIPDSKTAFARAFDDGSPALSTDSEPVTFLVLAPPPAVFIIACTQVLELPEGGSDVVPFVLSAADTVPAELTVTGDPGVTASPASFDVDGSGQEVTVSAAPGSAGATATITVTSPDLPLSFTTVSVTVVSS